MADAPSTPAPAIHSEPSIQDGKFLSASCSNISANRMVLTWEGSDGGSVPAGEDDAPGRVTVATDAPSDRSDNEPASSPSQRSLSISSKFNALLTGHAACQTSY
jgi:hypothetical protein